MKKTFITVSFSIVGLFYMMVIPGCSNVTFIKTTEWWQTQTRIDSLQLAIITLQNTIIEKQDQTNEILRSIRADQQTGFVDIDRKNQMLKDALMDSQSRLNQISEKTQEITHSWQAKARADSMAIQQKTTECETAFSEAMSNFSAAKFDLCFVGMQQIINQYPSCDKAEEALYWSSECHLAQNRYDRAESLYKDYIRQYPVGKKICESLYKLGLIYEKTKKEKARNLVWSKLVAQCPNSDLAKAVKSRIR